MTASQPDPRSSPSTPVMLQIDSLTAGYGRTTVLRDVSLSVGTGEVVALLGPNGAGKTTLLRAASGLIQPSRGTIRLRGADITTRPAHRRSRDGLCLVPEGRGIFPNLSVRENLLLQCRADYAKAGTERVLDLFPPLRDRLGQAAGTLSGGQQQMLALGRAFAAEPGIVLLDEVSMGLAPRIIDQIFGALNKLAQDGIALLLVEQYVSRALAMADKIYILDRGQVSFSGSPRDINEDEIIERYLNIDIPERPEGPAETS
jgi:branched-chain amino acid transport system ATP-binding protein